MGRNRIVLDEHRYIIYGYDAPCNSYFAEYNDTKKNEYEPIEMIVFFQGVSKNRVIEFFEKYNAIKDAKEQTPGAFNNLILDLPC